MREFNALKKVWVESREPLMKMYAEIQATLHNAHFRSGRMKRFEAEDFLGGAKPQSVEQKKAALAALFGAVRRKSGEIYDDRDDPVKRSHG